MMDPRGSTSIRLSIITPAGREILDQEVSCSFMVREVQSLVAAQERVHPLRVKLVHGTSMINPSSEVGQFVDECRDDQGVLPRMQHAVQLTAVVQPTTLVFTGERTDVDASLTREGAGVHVWDADTEQHLQTYGSHIFLDVAFSHDGLTLFGAAWAGVILMWDMVTAECTGEFVPQGCDVENVGIEGIAVSPDDELVASAHCCASSTSVRIWDRYSMSEVNQLPADWPFKVRFAPARQDTIFVVSRECAALWDVHASAQLMKFDKHHDGLYAADISPEGNVVVTASTFLKLWNRYDGALLMHFEVAHDSPVTSVQFSPDGLHLHSLSEDAVSFWHRSSPACVATPINEQGNDDVEFHRSAQSADGTQLLTASLTEVRSWSWPGGVCLCTLAARDFAKFLP